MMIKTRKTILDSSMPLIWKSRHWQRMLSLSEAVDMEISRERVTQEQDEADSLPLAL
jgi:hypothetical protein